MQAPEGSTRGVLGTSGSSETGAPVFALTFDGDGGYDDNAFDSTGDDVSQFFAFQSGFVINGSASARFQAGTVERYVLGTASGGLNFQQIQRGDRFYRQSRRSASIQAATPLGRRNAFAVNAALSYDPTFVFGAFDAVNRNDGDVNPLAPEVTPTPDPTLSLTAQRWLTQRVGGGLQRSWTPRHRTSTSLSGLWLKPTSGPGIRTRTYSAFASHAWDRSPSTGLEFIYRFDRWRLTDQESAVSSPAIDAHTTEGRLRHERRLSPNKTLTFMGGGGAILLNADQLPQGQSAGRWSPTVSGSVQLSFLPVWSVSLGARRDVTVLGALSAEPFESNSATLALETTPGRRFSAGGTAGYSKGGARRSTTGGFTQASATARLQYAFGPSFGATVSYAYGHYRFSDIDVALAGAPSRFGRHSVRVGFTYWLPLYGTF